jgi:hypothetical protein
MELDFDAVFEEQGVAQQGGVFPRRAGGFGQGQGCHRADHRLGDGEGHVPELREAVGAVPGEVVVVCAHLLDAQLAVM